MSERMVVGLQPWLPWPLSRWPWWTEPVRAERLAALRIGIAVVLLLDIALNYLPHLNDFYGADGLGAPAVFESWRTWPNLNWTIVVNDDPTSLYLFLGLWILSAVGLLLGLATPIS